MKTLFDETRIGTISLKNRCIRSATWEAKADPSGHLTKNLIQVYEELARGERSDSSLPVQRLSPRMRHVFPG